MAINNFPVALQSIIQQNFLEREFQTSLQAKLGFRAIADRMDFPNSIGETIIKTRAGLLQADSPARSCLLSHLEPLYSAAGGLSEDP